MFPRSFFWKSFFSLLSTILLSAVLFGIVIYERLYEASMAEMQDRLKKETEMLAQLTMGSPDLVENAARIAGVVHTEDRITIIAPDGTVLADNWTTRLGKRSIENHASRPEFKAALEGHPTFARRVSRTVSDEMLYYAIPLKENGKVISVLRLSYPLTTFYGEMSKLRHFLILAALIAIVLSLGFAYALTVGPSHQMTTLRESANRLASGHLDHRIEPHGTVEFQELARDFNKMAEQLQQRMLTIQEQHQLNEALLAQMVEGVFALDSRGKALFANAAFCKMTGTRNERIQGRSFLEVIRNDQLSDFISGLLVAPHSKTAEAEEVQIVAQGEERHFLVQATWIPENAVLLLVFHDISHMKRTEQVRKDFVNNVGHELRTPLTAMKGVTEILLDGALLDPQECERFLKIMDKQLRNMENLINDMLKLASLEDSKRPPAKEMTSLKQMVGDVVSLLEPLAHRKNQELAVDFQMDDIHLFVDQRQIGDALMNLVDNAVKYTDGGGKILISVQSKNDEVTISVKDTGYGIAASQLPRIFERFYRVDKSRSREVSGTGLGLAIAKHAVENHSGTISVQSEAGKGSIFTIHLPATNLAL